MQILSNVSVTLAQWTQFVLFHVLPIAVAQIYDWVRDWQILVLGIFALIVFHFWSRRVMRAARRAARETVQSEAKTFDASLRLLRKQIDQLQSSLAAKTSVANVEQAERSPTLAKPAAQGAQQQPGPQPAEKAKQPAVTAVQPDPRPVEGLRQAIRLALPAIPLTDDPLTEKGLNLYKKAITYLKDEEPVEPAEGTALRPLFDALQELENSFPPATCRKAWQSLVQINTLARDLPSSNTAGNPQPPLTMSGQATG